MRKGNSPSHTDIVKWLKEKILTIEKCKVYESLEEIPEILEKIDETKKDFEFSIDPNLPVDLIRVKEEETENDIIDKFPHYTIFFVVSTPNIPGPPENRIAFYRRVVFYKFYLSRIISSKRLKIVLVAPKYTKINKEFLRDNGIGFWKFVDKEKMPIEVLLPTTLIEQMNNNFLEPENDESMEEFSPEAKKAIKNIDGISYEENNKKLVISSKLTEKKKKNLLQKPILKPYKETIEQLYQKSHKQREVRKEIVEKESNIAFFFDRYIHDAVSAIAGVKPEQFSKRYIDKEVMDKVLDLKNISYNKELSKVVTEHLTEKANEYQFVSEVFDALWRKHINLPYSDFLEKFEPSLQYVFAETRKGDKIYRDHYLHQFQVFLLGVSIIDNFHGMFKCKYEKPELSWLIASSFHDIAYPVQLYDDWCEKFFKEVFTIDKSPGTLELKSNFVDHSFLSCMGYIINSLYRSHLNKKHKSKLLFEKNDDLVQFFYNEITTTKNHGIMSSISLLKMIQTPKNKKKIENKFKKKFQKVLQEIFMPGVLAITLHESQIWSGLKEGRKKDKLHVVLPCLKFEDDPLSFLLIFCDSVQEWGRPSKTQEKEEFEKIKRFYLKEFICRSEPPEVKITINTPNHKGSYFSIDEFKDMSTVKALCNAIKKYGIKFTEQENSIERLNELLQIPNFYDILDKKTKLINTNEDTKNLIKITESYRDKNFSELDELQQKIISELNRLILETNHKKICPKNFFKEKKEELRRIQAFLQQPSNIKFVIRLEDKDKVGEDFEMKGHPS